MILYIGISNIYGEQVFQNGSKWLCSFAIEGNSYVCNFLYFFFYLCIKSYFSFSMKRRMLYDVAAGWIAAGVQQFRA